MTGLTRQWTSIELLLRSLGAQLRQRCLRFAID